MKKILAAFALLFFISCNNDKKQPDPVVEPPSRDTSVLQVCDFGIGPTEFNIADREPEQAAGKGGKKPVVRNPPAPSASPRGVLLLDFDGHTVSGTSWNFSGDIICAESGLSVEEQQKILDTVAVRYRQFNLLVTTDTNIFRSTPVNKRMRCIITKTYEWFGQAGGVSFVNSFGWGQAEAPCFVFSLPLNFNLKFIQEAVTHEVGHTFGCFHQSVWQDGVKVAEYRGGAIMGIGYYVSAPVWYNGTNPYGQSQNDTMVIKTTLSR